MSGSFTAGPRPTIGRDCSVTLLWNGTRIDLETVTGFEAMQQVKSQRSDPLNGVPLEFNTPSGWRGSFHADRGSSALDRLIAANEAAFWNSGIVGSGTIFQNITEADGSLTTFAFVGVAMTLSQAGSYVSEGIVKQTISFFASLRNKV